MLDDAVQALLDLPYLTRLVLVNMTNFSGKLAFRPDLEYFGVVDCPNIVGPLPSDW